MKQNLPLSTLAFLLSVERVQPFGQPIGIRPRFQTLSTVFSASDYSTLFASPTATTTDQHDNDNGDELDTVRVRIWRILMENNDEMSLKELSRAVNEKPSDVKFHLGHVEKQAKTLANKSPEWRERRGIPTSTRTVKVKKRLGGNGKRKEVFYRLG